MDTVWQSLVRGVAVSAVSVLAVTTGAPAAVAQVPESRVAPSLFGMHAISTAPALIPGLATVRLWDTDTTWRKLNPAPGVFSWATLDARVRAAELSHASVLLVLGATPAWATDIHSRDDASWLGPGTASPPRSLPDWSAFVEAVVERYRGRIEAYQIWNEPADPIFWRGTWDVLGRMTKAASDVIRREDPDALVVSAPLITRGPRWREQAGDYVQALVARGLPVDAVAFHGYAAGPPGPATALPVRRLQDLLASTPAGVLPLWETEVNFAREPSQVDALHSGAERYWLARAYLDALRLGVERVYWYAYADIPAFLAVDVRQPHVLPGFSTLAAWIAGAQFLGCTDTWQGARGVTGCSFRDRDGRTALSLWSDDEQVVLTGRGVAADLGGDTWSVASDLSVHGSPLWFLPSAAAD